MCLEAGGSLDSERRLGPPVSSIKLDFLQERTNTQIPIWLSGKPLQHVTHTLAYTRTHTHKTKTPTKTEKKRKNVRMCSGNKGESHLCVW